MNWRASRQKRVDQNLNPGLVVLLSRLMSRVAEARAGVMDGIMSHNGIVKIGTALGGANQSNQEQQCNHRLI